MRQKHNLWNFNDSEQLQMAHDSTPVYVLPRLQSAVDHMTTLNTFVVLSSRVSFEDLVLVLLGVGLKRPVPTETLQTTQHRQ